MLRRCGKMGSISDRFGKGSKGMTLTRKLTGVALGIVLAIAVVSPAYGQGGRSQPASQVPRYAPQSPTVSPYINLLNRNGSAASNYYGLIRPLERQQTINATQSQQAESQEQQIKAVKDQQQDFEQPKVKPTGTAGWFQNLGPTSPFQQSSHYYGQWPTRGQRKNTASTTAKR